MATDVLTLSGLIPVGWVQRDEFSVFGDIISIVAGDGVTPTAPRLLVSRNVPPGARVLVLELIIYLVDDQGYDQIQFSLERNNSPLYPFVQFPAEVIRDRNVIPVGIVIDPGELRIVGRNIAGQGLTGSADDALNFRGQASWIGRLLAFSS